MLAVAVSDSLRSRGVDLAGGLFGRQSQVYLASEVGSLVVVSCGGVRVDPGDYTR